jgi:hypothetical protein
MKISFFNLIGGFLVIAGLLQSGCWTWPDSPKRSPVGPDVPEDMVIYFKPGTDDHQVEEFISDLIYEPETTRGRQGRYHLSFGRLLPQQSHGYQAIAITFQSEATPEEVTRARVTFKESPIVLKIFENVAPDKIQKEDIPD